MKRILGQLGLMPRRGEREQLSRDKPGMTPLCKTRDVGFAMAMGLLVQTAVADALPGPVGLAVVFGGENADLHGKAALPVGQKVFVNGPLLQVAWPEGGMVSFQQGTLFEVVPTADGHPHIHLLAGGANAMREGNVPMTLSGPQGTMEIAPGSAINVQVGDGITAGRVMAGVMRVDSPEGARVFNTDEGFEVGSNGPQPTLTPPPAPSPTPADVEPGAGAERKENPKVKADRVAVGDFLAPAMTAYEKIIRTLTPVAALPPAPVMEPTLIDLPPPIEVALTPQELIDLNRENAQQQQPQPQPEPQAEAPPPAPTPEPQAPAPEPEPEPDPVRRDVFGGTTAPANGIAQPNNRTAEAVGMLFSEGENGEQRLEAYSAGQWIIDPRDGTNEMLKQTVVARGSAQHADTYSNGRVAGLGRWVGGRLEAVSDIGGQVNMVGMPDQAANKGGTSTHYIWGEQATQVPTQGSINYTLKAATTPTYYGKTDTVAVPNQPADARFDGSMRVDFAPGSNQAIGRYHFNGNVTLTENGQTVGYGMATAASGVVLRNSQLGSEGSLKITPTNGPGIACGGGGSCTGTVQVAPYGAGVQNLGALYAIKGAKSDVGLTGAALFGQ